MSATDGSPRTDAIRADIEATRERLGETLEELGSRLNPQRLKQQAKDAVHDATIGRVQNMARNTMDKATNTGKGIADVVRENPIPIALIALGAGWLLYNKRSGSSEAESYSGPIEGYAGEDIDTEVELDVTADRALNSQAQGGKLSAVTSGAQQAAHRVAETAGNAAQTVSRQTRMQAGRARDAFEEQPLVLGAIVAAVGLAAGFAVPSTTKESELLGEKRDELVDKARDVVREKTEQVRHVAERVVTDAKTSAKQAARDEGLAG
jgi:ElaB/YqjD/DUF883 family membrane-anchored ribosome-binding protein